MHVVTCINRLPAVLFGSTSSAGVGATRWLPDRLFVVAALDVRIATHHVVECRLEAVAVGLVAAVGAGVLVAAAEAVGPAVTPSVGSRIADTSVAVATTTAVVVTTAAVVVAAAGGCSPA